MLTPGPRDGEKDGWMEGQNPHLESYRAFLLKTLGYLVCLDYHFNFVFQTQLYKFPIQNYSHKPYFFSF